MHDNFLRYFDEVARQGSIRKAAKILNMSSTSVNRKILSTEQQLGVKLFHRNAEGVKLTSAGSVVLEHCRKTLFDFGRMSVQIEDIRDNRTGHIEIMTLDSIAIATLPQILFQFSENYPEVTYSVKTGQPEEIIQAVANADADIGLSFWDESHPGVRTLAEKAAPIGVIMIPNHPLSERNQLSISDLQGFHLTRSIDARGGHSILDQVISDLTTSLSTRVFTNSLPLAKQMILKGSSVGLYTKFGFLEEIESGQLRFIPLEVAHLKQLKIGVIVSSTVNFAPIKHAVCNEIAKTFRDITLDS
ncbi:MAG: LysR family transcriptional regulator [Rhizobiaceae bacterium]